MTDSELAEQLSSLDWGGAAPAARPLQVVAPTSTGGLGDLDVDVPGVAPRKVKVTRPAGEKRSHHKKLPKTVASSSTAPSVSVVGAQHRARRPRETMPDVLVRKGESPAVVSLFETMWRDVGHQLALEIDRPKASRQDAALGWYMFLLAMRARDARS